MTPMQAHVAALSAVHDVERTYTNPNRIADAALEAPEAGSEQDIYALTFAGWALGMHVPVVAVELHHAGLMIAELEVNISRPDIEGGYPAFKWARSTGFGASISSLRLHPDFEVIIILRLEDGSRSGFARVTGRREPLRSTYEPRFSPLMVTTLGRTGSTWLIRLLGLHSDLLNYRPFQLEPRAATYWLDLMVSLSEPAASFNQLDADVDFERPWWLGKGGRVAQLPDPKLQAWMMRGHVEELAQMAQQRIDSTYAQVASFHPRRSPTHFVEKFLPDNSIPQLAWELYPDAREIFLVRDFRDMLCSMRSYDAKRGVDGFGRDGAESEDLYIREVLGTTVKMMLDSWHRRAERAHLVRYEDLILEPEQTLRGALEYVGVDASPSAVRSILERSAKQTADMRAHQTTAGPEESIGRWRRDLEPELQEACEAAFGPALKEFGYALSE